MKKEEKMTFVIDPDKNKSDIIYDNIIGTFHLTMDEQVKYLRRKNSLLEEKLAERTKYTFLFLFTFLALCFGIGLLCFDFYILGTILIITTFIFVIITLLLNFKIKTENLRTNEFDKIDEYISILKNKLK